MNESLLKAALKARSINCILKRKHKLDGVRAYTGENMIYWRQGKCLQVSFL